MLQVASERRRDSLTLYYQISVLSLQIQYQQIMAFLKELDRREREMLFREWRPKVPITGKYAVTFL